MNGWSSRSCLYSLLVVTVTLLPVHGLAEPDQGQERPAMELLEFLAEWETEQGEWVGPDRFEDDSFDQLYDEEETGTDD